MGGSGGGASLLLRRSSARKCTLSSGVRTVRRAGGQEHPRQPPWSSSMCPPRRRPCTLPRPVTGVGSGRERGRRRAEDGGKRKARSLIPALVSTGLVGPPPRGAGRGEVSGPAHGNWQAVGTEEKSQ